jgi:hypothetical protein
MIASSGSPESRSAKNTTVAVNQTTSRAAPIRVANARAIPLALT